ncbi:MAG: PAS domain-containing protein [Planctomycetia bacterium]|nr:PAS domain-containing protein [Planctomycetia bacterium]
MAIHDGPDRDRTHSRTTPSEVAPPEKCDAPSQSIFAPEFAPAILRSLLDHTPAIVSLYDASGVHRYANRVMPGMQAGDVIGRHISEMVPGEYRDEVSARFERAVASQQPEEITLPGIGPDGRAQAYQGRVVPVVHDEKVVAMLAVVTEGADLVERRDAELRAQWYTRLVEQVDLGLYVLKLEETSNGHTLRNVSTNPAAERLTGITSQDWVGRTIDDVYPGLRARGLVEMAVRVVTTGVPEDIGHFLHEQANVSGTDWTFSMFPLLDRHVGVMFADITARKRVERQTRRMLDELARASRISTMREMASGLAHELNQPLSAIVAYVDACQELVESGRMNNRQLADVLRSVSKQAERAGRIIHRLRQMIRRDQPSRTLISINDAVGETAALFEATGRQAGVTIKVDLAGDLPEVLADIVQIQHVLLNLMHNAIDAVRELPQNRRQLTIVTSRPAEREVEVAVCDLGHGLTGESAGRLFEPFFSTNPVGLGLGLSISRTIIEAHGGRIEVVPNPDAGVTARFTLPVSSGKVNYVPTADSVHR